MAKPVVGRKLELHPTAPRLTPEEPAAPPEGFKHPQNGAAARYLEEPTGVESTR